MSKIASPIRLILPFLDDWFPRHAVIQEVHALNARYGALLDAKKNDLGLDLLSYLLEDSALSTEELISNFSILFSAGHVRLRSLISKMEFPVTVSTGYYLRRPINSRIPSCPAPRIPIHSTRRSPLRASWPRRTHICRPRPSSLPQRLHQRSAPDQQPHISPARKKDDRTCHTGQVYHTCWGIGCPQCVRGAPYREELDESGEV